MSEPLYKRSEAKAVRDAANADPATLCALCGEAARSDDKWVANRGHLLGLLGLVAVHSSCSSQFGGKRGHPTGQEWRE